VPTVEVKTGLGQHEQTIPFLDVTDNIPGVSLRQYGQIWVNVGVVKSLTTTLVFAELEHKLLSVTE
jgi:hypothetical protein